MKISDTLAVGIMIAAIVAATNSGIAVPPVYTDGPGDMGRWIEMLKKKESVVEKGRRRYPEVEMAAHVIGGFGPIGRSAVKPLLDLLYDEEFLECFWSVAPVVVALGKIGPHAKAAEPRLREILGTTKSPGGDVIHCTAYLVEAAEALWRITGDADFVVPYLEKLNESPAFRRASVQALGRIGAPAEAALARMLHSRNDATRSEAVKALSSVKEPGSETMKALADAILDKGEGEFYFRSNAADLLAGFGSDAKDTLPTLKKAATEFGDIAVAKAVLQVSGNPDEAIPSLIAVLDKGRIYSQRTVHNFQLIEAAKILGGMGAKAESALPLLRKALDDDDPAWREAAREAIKRIENPDDMDAFIDETEGE